MTIHGKYLYYHSNLPKNDLNRTKVSNCMNISVCTMVYVTENTVPNGSINQGQMFLKHLRSIMSLQCRYMNIYFCNFEIVIRNCVAERICKLTATG